MKHYTALFPFCGLGSGALGFVSSRVRIGADSACIRSLGGIDVDPLACADFERLTGSPALCTDIETLTPEELRRFAGDSAPDLMFASPPCKGASALLGKRRARTPKYLAMNELMVVWVRLMLRTWETPPRLVLIENVPRIKQRAGDAVAAVRALLKNAGYVLHDGFHECGELGGLAQMRRRWLLVARHTASTGQLLYEPPRKRVRGCGEVLGALPIPGDVEAAGPLHTLPRLSWKNWIRLALIPAGGDWRDIPGVLNGRARRAVFRRYHLAAWSEPSETVAGSGTNGPYGVCDPRLGLSDNPNRHWGKYRVEAWDRPAHSVTGAVQPGSGAPSVADPRLSFECTPYAGSYGVLDVGEPCGTVTGRAAASTGRFSVADPRIAPPPDCNWHPNAYGVLDWRDPSGTVTTSGRPSGGRFTVGDVRVQCSPRSGVYGVLRWEAPSGTVIGAARIDNGRWAVADPRLPDSAPHYVDDLVERPRDAPVIVSADGTWHRPLTTLDLATLQGIPSRIGANEPLTLAGSQTSVRERIGNAVPTPTGQAIADQMLVTLLTSDGPGFSLHGDGSVWVERPYADAVRFAAAPALVDYGSAH